VLKERFGPVRTLSSTTARITRKTGPDCTTGMMKRKTGPDCTAGARRTVTALDHDCGATFRNV